MLLRVLAIFVTLFLIPGLQAQESDPAALALFDAALSKLEARSVLLKKWQYHQTLTTHQFSDNDKIIAKGTWKSIFRPDEKDPIEYLSENLEGTLTFFHKKPEKAAGKSASTEVSPVPKEESQDGIDDSQSNNRIESLADAISKYGLRERYVWTCLPDEKAAGEAAAVIAFSPKTRMPVKTREERFFSQLSGKIWISREDSTVLKSEGALLEPYRVFWIIARITTLTFAYEVEPNPASRVLRKSKASAETIVAFPFNQVHQKHWLEVRKFEPRTPRK